MTTQSNDFLLDILETDEQGLRGIFQNFGIGQGRSQNEQRIGNSLFQPIFGSFLGQIANELQQGAGSEGGPELSNFRNFVGQNFDFDRSLLQSNDRSFSNQNVLGRAGTQFDFGQQGQQPLRF